MKKKIENLPFRDFESSMMPFWVQETKQVDSCSYDLRSFGGVNPATVKMLSSYFFSLHLLYLTLAGAALCNTVGLCLCQCKFQTWSNLTIKKYLQLVLKKIIAINFWSVRTVHNIFLKFLLKCQNNNLIHINDIVVTSQWRHSHNYIYSRSRKIQATVTTGTSQ
jgi:hypothetical protein